MNILIVDDEPRHRRGMMNLILSLSPGNRLNAVGDGEAALKRIREDRPDLVLTDIRMPNMDGLQFLKRLESERPKPRVVMVSAYNLFDYAQEALRYGASDYLLKPVDGSKHEAMLRRIEKELELEERQRHETNEQQRRLGRAQSVYRSRLFADWLEGSLPADEARELERTERLQASGLVIFTEIGIKPRRQDFDAQQVLGRLEKGWSQLGDASSFVLDSWQEGIMQAVTIIRGSAPLSSEERTAIRGCAERMLGDLETYGEVFHGIGPFCALLQAEGADAFRLAREAGSHGIRRSLHGPVFYDERPAPEAASANPEVCANAEAEADALAADCLKWIEEHLHEELTLERAAERFFFNPSYFSTWIKQQTGSTFTHHLTEARMQRARLLLGAGRRIRETAEACGYPDTKYFCRVFKKMHGMSPAAYKHGSIRQVTAE
ncbi:response regulator [Saccharibacillus qingshengii]|uniref:response regulator n=1 Tax=Saccharibacillus qingshengii TaxID=1763540 RepID=UPI001555566D|nr:response regulator [Saccharibacillus qingshengii]